MLLMGKRFFLFLGLMLVGWILMKVGRFGGVYVFDSLNCDSRGMRFKVDLCVLV